MLTLRVMKMNMPRKKNRRVKGQRNQNSSTHGNGTPIYTNIPLTGTCAESAGQVFPDYFERRRNEDKKS